MRETLTEPRPGPRTTSRAPAVVGGAMAGLVIVALVTVTLAVASLVLPVRDELGLAPLLGQTWNPARGEAGGLPFIYGSLVTSTLALALAVPGGLGVAVFLSDLGPARLRGVVETAVQILAAIPSVAYGLWGAIALAPFVRDVAPSLELFFAGARAFQGPSSGFAYLTAGLVLALMVLPTIATFANEVLRAVPNTLREGGLALGATPTEVVVHLVLPQARRGLVGAVLLGFARAASESVAVALVVGSRAAISRSLLAPGYTIPSVIVNEFAHAQTPLHEGALAALGLVLLAVTMTVTVGARLLLRRTTADAPARSAP